MRSTRFAVAALMLALGAACSNDERETSFVSEARADFTSAKDFGWRTTPEFSAGQKEVREYY
jgi:hypothetical protein